MKLILVTSAAFFVASLLSGESIQLDESDGKVRFLDSDENLLLAYQFETYPAPEGADPAFARSGFIHPLNAPDGQRLTQIQPADHYHHYGIWNPWTQVTFRGEVVDFWNLAKKQGTVRFAGFVERSETGDSASIEVKHEHVVFEENDHETIALEERQTIRVNPLDDQKDAYQTDLVIELSCGTDDPVRLMEYRYGGLGWRTTEAWNGENSEVLTSEGIDRSGADGSLARWCIVQGEVEGGYAGIVVMSHPDNYNHPEPLRIWPAGNHDGQIFFNYSPTKNTDWLLEPGETYTLRYRLLVFNGKRSAEEAEAAWRAFAN